MRKLLLTAFSLSLAVPALAAQQDIAQLSAVTASREALRTAVNTQLSAVQANFDEVYAVIDAGPVYVNASAPADQKVVWIDTDQSNAIKVYVGGVWTVVGSGGIAGDDLGSAAYGDVVALWATCTGYLKSDGTCDTPSGSATYPSAAGVANWGGSAWGTSYTVGTAANNLVQLNGTAQLPAVSGALLTNIPMPSWLPAAAPTADNMIIQATGGCSNIAYTDQATCEANSGTWTPPVGAWTSIIDGLINDAGTGTDDLLSASEIDTRISSAVAFYQVADGDLDTAAGASAAGNSKLFGTNASGVAGWYDIPVDTDTDDQVASEVGFTPNGSIAATTVQAAVQEVRDEAEPVLGNPAANGYVLSSTTTGTRSWVAQSGGTDEFVYLADCSTITNGICVDTDDGGAYYWDGTTVTAVGSGGSVDLTAPGPIGSVTPNTGAFTTLVADSFDFTAPVSGTTGEIGLQEDPDNGSSLVTLKAPASLAADLVFTLPTAYPATSGSVLESTTTGALSWSAKYVTAPTTATDTCTAGQMAYASGFLYVCVAANTWRRATMATW